LIELTVTTMEFIKKFKGFNEKLSLGFEWVGVAAFVLMMLLTTFDVVGAKLFLRPVPGALDLMMIFQLLAMAFALSVSYIKNRHVEVEFFMPLLPGFIQRVVAFLVQTMMLGLLVVMAWQLYLYGHDLKMYGEVSSTIRIPLYPFTYAAALAFIPVCLVALAKWFEALVKVFTNES
jgi:TRAP-type C4-dicarboxylate transport system permease small subunit